MNSVRRIQTFTALTVLLAGASTAMAQPQAAILSNPHTSVSSDGTTPPRSEASLDFAEGFEGLGPALATADARFEETGAMLDGAEEVIEEEAAGTLSPVNLWGGSIIGPDSRTRVNQTTVYPARAIALVTFSTTSGGGWCSGWFINKDTVVTAGHCVHSGGTDGEWHTNVRVYPGRNGTSSPYGSCGYKRLHSVTGWTSSKNETYDYGAIKLNCTVGNTVGWFGFFTQGSSLNGLPATVAGYPGDKANPVANSYQQWRATGSIAATQARQVFYKNDTLGGQSGAPVYYNKSGCGQCSMAIHAYGVHPPDPAPHGNNNHGTRITQAVFNNLVAWRDAS